MLIAFVALVNLVNWPLGLIGERLQLAETLNLNWIFGKVLAPVAWIMGVDGWHDCQLFGSLLGTKVAVNEFVAFGQLIEYLPSEGAVGKVFEHSRSAKMAAYALCGFANFASVGIQIGGITPLAPERRADLSRLAMRAMLGGAFASWMTATIAGMFLA
jgi:CNT family concentrative nucleoside transporter